jgi:hypothetical protein
VIASLETDKRSGKQSREQMLKDNEVLRIQSHIAPPDKSRTGEPIIKVTVDALTELRVRWVHLLVQIALATLLTEKAAAG